MVKEQWWSGFPLTGPLRAHFGKPTLEEPSVITSKQLYTSSHNIVIVYQVLIYWMCCTRFVFIHMSYYVISFCFFQLNKKKNLSIPYVLFYYYYLKFNATGRSQVIIPLPMGSEVGPKKTEKLTMQFSFINAVPKRCTVTVYIFL